MQSNRLIDHIISVLTAKASRKRRILSVDHGQVVHVASRIAFRTTLHNSRDIRTMKPSEGLGFRTDAVSPGPLNAPATHNRSPEAGPSGRSVHRDVKIVSDFRRNPRTFLRGTRSTIWRAFFSGGSGGVAPARSSGRPTRPDGPNPVSFALHSIAIVRGEADHGVRGRRSSGSGRNGSRRGRVAPGRGRVR